MFKMFTSFPANLLTALMLLIGIGMLLSVHGWNALILLIALVVIAYGLRGLTGGRRRGNNRR